MANSELNEWKLRYAEKSAEVRDANVALNYAIMSGVHDTGPYSNDTINMIREIRKERDWLWKRCREMALELDDSGIRGIEFHQDHRD